MLVVYVVIYIYYLIFLSFLTFFFYSFTRIKECFHWVGALTLRDDCWHRLILLQLWLSATILALCFTGLWFLRFDRLLHTLLISLIRFKTFPQNLTSNRLSQCLLLLNRLVLLIWLLLFLRLDINLFFILTASLFILFLINLLIWIFLLLLDLSIKLFTCWSIQLYAASS